MKFVELVGKGNVDISFYNVEDIDGATVGGLLTQIAGQGGFGDITIRLANYPFRICAQTHYGKNVSITIPADIANVPVVYASASGGWGRTDFEICI